MAQWHKTACIICTSNCGIEVQLGGEGGGELVLVRGDKDHPISRGYACEKPQRLNYYQSKNNRLLRPLRRTANGGFEEVDWDTAITEVAQKLTAIRDAHGGDKIFYYGGGGQGNHMPTVYSTSTRGVLGVRYSSNALAQEKTGEMWVTGKMFGGWPHPDFEHAQCAVFVGKNPWQSHGIPRARVILREIARDPDRTLIVVDPRRTETAEIADIHLQVKPGRDAWLVAAIVAVLIQEDLIDRASLDERATGLQEVADRFARIDVVKYAEIAGVDISLIREAARRIAAAESTALLEDLGVQQNRHSTLLSYLNCLVWALTGNFAKKGGMGIPPGPLGGGPVISADSGSGEVQVTPVTKSRIIAGLTPCNVIAEEILTDHPGRFRAMIVESSNPAHSIADSLRMKQALSALDFLVVIDVALTETARLADYVLPVTTQFEKPEFTFFNIEYPANFFHVRRPIIEPPEGPLAEPEIHARLVEAMGGLPVEELESLRAAATEGRDAFRNTLFASIGANPKAGQALSVLLYRTLGPTLPAGMEATAALWGLITMRFMSGSDAVRRAGFASPDELFDALIAGPSAVITAVEDYEDTWNRVVTADRKIHLAIPELDDELNLLETAEPLGRSDEWPFLLSAGERRSFTANVLMRNPEWRKKDTLAALRISLDDARDLGVADGDLVRLTTRRASVEVPVEVTDVMQPGHVSLPNGGGLEFKGANQETHPIGIAPNDLTHGDDRDPIAGTPWHKSVPARVEVIGRSRRAARVMAAVDG